MKSKLGYLPNGSLYLKNPQKYFIEEDFKNIINQWSKGIVNNPIPDLGSKITFNQIQIFPVYVAYAICKFEKRYLEKVKIESWNSSERRSPLIKINQIQPDKYEIEETRENQIILIEDSQYVEDCGNCGATGQILYRCDDCAGTGKILKKVADPNDPKNKHVTGLLTGDTIYVHEPCAKCSAKGQYYNICKVCFGKKGCTHAINLHIDYSVSETFSKLYASDKIDSSILTQKDFVFQDNINNISDLVNYLNDDIKLRVKEDLNNFKNQSKVDGVTYLKDEVKYGYSFITYVSYTYEGEDYSLIISGDKDKVHAPHSPLNKKVNSSLEVVNKHLLEKDFKLASKTILQTASIGACSEEIKSLISKLQLKLAEALFHMSDRPNVGMFKRHQFHRAAYKYSKSSFSNKTWRSDYKIELILYLLIPIISFYPLTALLLSLLKLSDFPSILNNLKPLLDPLLQTNITHELSYIIPSLVGISIFCILQCVFFRGVTYKKTWRYFANALLLAPSFTSFSLMFSINFLSFKTNSIATVLISIFLLMFVFFINNYFIKFTLKDKFLSVIQDFNFIEPFLRDFNEDLDEIYKYLPDKNFSYIDNFLKGDKESKNTDLIEKMQEISKLDKDINFYPNRS